MKQIPPCFHGAIRYLSVLLAQSGAREPWGNPWNSDSQTVGPGKRGGSHAHTYTHTHHTRLQSTDKRRGTPRRVHLQIRASPVHPHYATNRRMRPHTLLPFMHGHHTQPRDTRAHTCSRTCAPLRAHAHTPCTHPLAHAQALIHMHTPGAHAHTRSTHRLVHARTLAHTRSHR